MPEAEVRILSPEGGIIRWKGDDAETIAGLLAQFREAAVAKGHRFPEPTIVQPGRVHRKVTIIRGEFLSADEAGGPRNPLEAVDVIRRSDTAEPVNAAHLVPLESVHCEQVFRFEVEATDAKLVDAGRPKPDLKIVRS